MFRLTVAKISIFSQVSNLNKSYFTLINVFLYLIFLTKYFVLSVYFFYFAAYNQIEIVIDKYYNYVGNQL